MSRRLKELEKKMGQAVLDFVNAGNSDEASLRLLDNLFEQGGFTLDLAEKVKGGFPTLTSVMSVPKTEEKAVAALFAKEKELINRLREKIRWPKSSYELQDYDRDEKELTFVELGVIDIGEGQPDFVDKGQKKIKITETENLALIFEDLSVLDDITKLDIICLHQEILTLQRILRDIIENIIQGVSFTRIEDLSALVESYNALPNLTIRDSGFEKVSFSGNKYLEIDKPGNWSACLEEDLVRCLVEFLSPQRNREYLRKCQECQKYFLATRLNEQKYCSSKCRLAYHNRRRIESGEAAEYKRKKRKEGAKESYY